MRQFCCLNRDSREKAWCVTIKVRWSSVKLFSLILMCLFFAFAHCIGIYCKKIQLPVGCGRLVMGTHLEQKRLSLYDDVVKDCLHSRHVHWMKICVRVTLVEFLQHYYEYSNVWKKDFNTFLSGTQKDPSHFWEFTVGWVLKLAQELKHGGRREEFPAWPL